MSRGQKTMAFKILDELTIYNEILKMEEYMLSAYNKHIKNIADPYILKTFNEIIVDEQKHVNIAKNFIRLASK